ncbi:hypothetical protein HY008_00740 [Candidatus Woesebacteria bacterium]|nr:hypothetical protein [Candidatus Woesebacteria bacterium]
MYLDERVKYAKIWLEKYATPEYKMSLVTSQSQSSLNLSDKQKLFLSKLVGLIEKEKDVDRLQTSLYNLAKELGLPSKEAFGGIYKVLLGKDHGPKAAWLIMSEKDKVKERLQSL